VIFALKRLWHWLHGRRYFINADYAEGADYSCEVTVLKHRDGTTEILKVRHLDARGRKEKRMNPLRWFARTKPVGDELPRFMGLAAIKPVRSPDGQFHPPCELEVLVLLFPFNLFYRAARIAWLWAYMPWIPAGRFEYAYALRKQLRDANARIEELEALAGRKE